MSVADIISVLSVIVAVMAAGITTVLYVRTIALHKNSLSVQVAAWKHDYFSELHEWARLTEITLSEAVHLCDLNPGVTKNPSYFDRRHQLRVELSALIDQGRWYFPNLMIDEFGQGKELAFRGYRQEVLDQLVAAYRLIGKLSYTMQAQNNALRAPLKDIKRAFTAEIQKTLDPRSRDRDYERIMAIDSADVGGRVGGEPMFPAHS